MPLFYGNSPAPPRCLRINSGPTWLQSWFDDAHLTKSAGHPCLIIDERDTTDLETTVRRAIADAQRAGVHVLRVEVPALDHINAELAARS
jgi:hypothetical protein